MIGGPGPGRVVRALFLPAICLAMAGGDARALECAIKSDSPSRIIDTAAFTLACDGPITVRVAWEFGDGEGLGYAAGQTRAGHKYAAAGSYTVFARIEGEAFPAFIQHTVLYPATPGKPTHSSTLAYDARRGRIWCVNVDNHSVTVADTRALERIREIPVGRHPRTLARDSLGRVWVANQEDATLTLIDGASLAVLETLPLARGSRPYGICFDPKGGTAYVTLEGTGKVIRIDAATRSVTGSLEPFPTPRGIAVNHDGGRVLVTRFLSPRDRGEVADIKAQPFELAGIIPLEYDTHAEDGSNAPGVPNAMASITISPDGRRAWIPFKKDNVRRGKHVDPDGPIPTFEHTVRTGMAQIDLAAGKEALAARKDLDNRSMACATAFDGEGALAYVATLTSNHTAVLHASTGIDVTAIEPVSLEHELGPDGLVVADGDSLLFIHYFLSRELAAYDITRAGKENSVVRLALIPTVEKEKLPLAVAAGKRVFYNAADSRMARDRYLSCATCHLDGGADGRVWDFTHKGEGMRATPSLLGRGGMAQGPVHWSANFDEIQDFEHDVRGAFGGIGFLSDGDFHGADRDKPLGGRKTGLSPDLDALSAYVSSLTEAHASPFRNGDGSLTAAGEAGKKLFLDEGTGCARCHVPPLYTDSRLPGAASAKGAAGPGDVVTAEGFLLHDVGTLKPGSGQRLGDTLRGFDTPSLLGLWEKPAYLHDGSAATLMEVITSANAGDRHGRTSHLSAREKEELVAFLNQIEGGTAADGIPRRISAAPHRSGMRAWRSGAGWRFTWAWPGVSAHTRMRLFDGRGALVRELGPARTGGADLEFFWDGRDRVGARAGTGVYQVRLLYETGSRARSLYLDAR